MARARPRARGDRGLLQRGRIGAARCAVPAVGRHVRLRTRTARAMVGLRRGLVLRHGEDGVLRGDGADLRGLRHARLRARPAAARHRRRRPSHRGDAAWRRAHRAPDAGARRGQRRDPRPDRRPPAHERRDRCRSPDGRHAGRLRRTAGGRTALLRLRGVRADRDARGGGARAGADDPAGDRHRPRGGAAPLPRDRRVGAPRRRARRARRERGAAADSGGARRCNVGEAGRHGRRSRREPRRPARAAWPASRARRSR